jgi:hypothetical protein
MENYRRKVFDIDRDLTRRNTATITDQREEEE